MTDVEALDDPIWEYVMVTKLTPYVQKVREFWANIENIQVNGTGVYPIDDNDCPGLMYRVTNTPVRSPIKGVQVFPFVPTVYLQITNVAGGYTRMVSRVCADNKLKIDEFTIVEKHNLPSTYHQGQFCAFVPTDILEGTKDLGKWVYMTTPEMIELCSDHVSVAVKQKLIKYI